LRRPIATPSFYGAARSSAALLFRHEDEFCSFYLIIEYRAIARRTKAVEDYAAEVANAIGSTMEASSFSGLLTLVEIGQIRIGSAGNDRITSEQMATSARICASAGRKQCQGHGSTKIKPPM
jgi:hypothetical protein